MPRPARRLFTLCSAVSLVLCVVVCVLWVRSYWVADLIRLAFGDEWPLGAVYSSRGSFTIHVRERGNAPVFRVRTGYKPVNVQEYMRRSFGDTNWQRFGFGFLHARNHRQWTVSVPGWLVAAAFAVLPIVQYGRHRRASRCDALGLCRLCGYNLRATPERCPECGAVNSGLTTDPY